MSELTLLLLRLGFLVMLWAFVFAVVYALRSDLFGARVRRMPEAAAAAARPDVPSAGPDTEQVSERSQPHASGSTPTRLVITGGPREGMEIDLPGEQLTIGRSSESGLVIRDEYTSTHHARLMLWDDRWVVQDLDSTNGTFVDGARVTTPTTVPAGVPVTIGTTSFELRR